MIISLKTENTTLLKIFEVPFIGSIIILIMSMAPLPVMFIANAFFHFTDTESLERINIFISAFWNLILAFACRTTISIFFIPCWALFLLIGFLKYFGVIGS